MKKNIVKAICLMIVVSVLIGLVILKIQDNVRKSNEDYAQFLQQRQHIFSNGFENRSEATAVCKELYKENTTSGVVRVYFNRSIVYFAWVLRAGEKTVQINNHIFGEEEFESYFQDYHVNYEYQYSEPKNTSTKSYHRDVTAEDIADTEAVEALSRAIQHEREGIYDYK